MPLATLYLTERCNSRCVTCDYWRHGRVDMSFESVGRWLPGFEALGTQVVLISGGEPLLQPAVEADRRAAAQPGAEVMAADLGAVAGQARPKHR